MHTFCTRLGKMLYEVALTTDAAKQQADLTRTHQWFAGASAGARDHLHALGERPRTRAASAPRPRPVHATAAVSDESVFDSPPARPKTAVVHAAASATAPAPAPAPAPTPAPASPTRIAASVPAAPAVVEAGRGSSAVRPKTAAARIPTGAVSIAEEDTELGIYDDGSDAIADSPPASPDLIHPDHVDAASLSHATSPQQLGGPCQCPKQATADCMQDWSSRCGSSCSAARSRQERAGRWPL